MNRKDAMDRKDSLKRMSGRVLAILIGLWVMMLTPENVYGVQDSESLLGELMEEVDFSELDSFMEETGSDMTFYELMSKILQEGWGVESIEKLMNWAFKEVFYELQANKDLFLEVILIAFCFSLLKNTAGSFGTAYMSEACFLLTYSVLGLLLLKSMYLFQGIVSEFLEKSVAFLQVFVPCFCTGMFISANTSASVGFGQIALVVIYMIEIFFQKVLLPGIHVYVLLQIFNHFFEEGGFGNLAELVRTVINWGLKTAMTVVVGLTAVQNLINPVKDRMAQGVFGKVVSTIPGIGSAVSGMNEVLIGSGMMIKNGIGLAGIAVFVLLGLNPMVKAGCMTLIYKVMAAITEPITDHRISSCLKDLSEGAMLYMKLLGNCLLLFFVLIAVTISATCFIY